MWDLIKGDWEKLPQDFRFFIEVGIALVFNSWLLDHWLPNKAIPYMYLGHFDLREVSYDLGMSLIYFSIVVLIIKQLLNLPNLLKNYKIMYPIKNIGKSFDLVWFSGKLILFDHERKIFYHVYPWETAEDLDFVSYGTHVQDIFPNPQNPKVKLDSGKILDTGIYANGGSINTRK